MRKSGEKELQKLRKIHKEGPAETVSPSQRTEQPAVISNCAKEKNIHYGLLCTKSHID